MIISQKKTKGSKQRDHYKESKKLGKDTHLKEDDSEKTMCAKSCKQQKKENKRETKNRKTQKTKKETRDKQKERRSSE